MKEKEEVEVEEVKKYQEVERMDEMEEEVYVMEEEKEDEKVDGIHVERRKNKFFELLFV